MLVKKKKKLVVRKDSAHPIRCVQRQMMFRRVFGRLAWPAGARGRRAVPRACGIGLRCCSRGPRDPGKSAGNPAGSGARPGESRLASRGRQVRVLPPGARAREPLGGVFRSAAREGGGHGHGS